MARDVFPRTISRGVLRGQSFGSKWEYQQARSQALGFGSYGQERELKKDPTFFIVRQKAQEADRTLSRAEAIKVARRIVGSDTGPPIQKEPRRLAKMTSEENRQRMRRIIERAMKEGIWTSGDDAADAFEYYP